MQTHLMKSLKCRWQETSRSIRSSSFLCLFSYFALMIIQRYNFFYLRYEPVLILIYQFPRKTKIIFGFVLLICEGNINYFWISHLFELIKIEALLPFLFYTFEAYQGCYMKDVAFHMKEILIYISYISFKMLTDRLNKFLTAFSPNCQSAMYIKMSSFLIMFSTMHLFKTAVTLWFLLWFSKANRIRNACKCTCVEQKEVFKGSILFTGRL